MSDTQSDSKQPTPPTDDATPAVSPETESAAAAANDAIINALVAELTEAKQTADEAKDATLRAQAELQNFKRRKEKEAAERIAQANARLILELLPSLDDFELAFANVPAELDTETASWVLGFDLIRRKLNTLVEREGVVVIDATGAFDPNLHEAISHEPSDTVPSGHIIAEVRRGYRLNDRVLRPSYVRVAI